MTAETVSKTHYEDGQTVHYHWMQRQANGDYVEGPVPFTLRTASDYAVIVSPEGPDCEEAGCVKDIVNNLDTAITFIGSGELAIALDPENQAALDYERELYVDCFGV